VQKKGRVSRTHTQGSPLRDKLENDFIGEILVKLGYLDEQDIVAALVIQLGLPYIAVNKYTIDPAIVRLIPFEVAKKEKVIALDRIGDILSVVMINPLTEDKKIFLESLTQCRIVTLFPLKRKYKKLLCATIAKAEFAYAYI